MELEAPPISKDIRQEMSHSQTPIYGISAKCQVHLEKIMCEVLSRFGQYYESTEKHRCTNDFIQGLKLQPTKYARHHSYTDLNPFSKKYLIVDFDEPYHEQKWIRDGNPSVTIAVINPSSKRAHLFFELITPVSFQPKSRRGPQYYCSKVEQALTNSVGGDVNFVGLFVKNPLSKSHEVKTNDVSYHLDDFMKTCPSLATAKNEQQRLRTSTKSKSRQNANEKALEGRNSYIFHTVRFPAYRWVHAMDSHSFKQKVLDESVAINLQFPSILSTVAPLPQKEVIYLADNISGWCLKNKHRLDGKNRGVMGFGNNRFTNPFMEHLDDDEVARRQALGGAYASWERKQKTSKVIAEFISAFISANGTTPNISQIARGTNLARITVQRWKNEPTPF